MGAPVNRPDDATWDRREAHLVASLRRFYKGELSEGRLLRTLRKDALGLTQQRYADLAGISRRTLSDLEGDKGNVTVEVMTRAFRPLGLKVGLLPRHPELLEVVLLADGPDRNVLERTPPLSDREPRPDRSPYQTP
jgi:transcriptional regulator with XRE-family HTH domain